MKPALALLLLGLLLAPGKNHSTETKAPPQQRSLIDPEYPDLPLTPVSKTF